MKKLLVLMMLLVCSVCTFSLELKTKETRREDRAARAKAKAQAKEKAKEEKQKQKTSAKEFEGQYLKATNTFYYVKDKLVLPNKKVTYTLNDQTGLIDGIYQFMAEKYGVSDMDLVTFKVSGTVSKDGVLTVSKIRNYRIPEDKLYQNGGYIPDGGYAPTTTDTPGVTVQPQGSPEEVRILDIPSIGPNK